MKCISQLISIECGKWPVNEFRVAVNVIVYHTWQ